MCFLFQAFKVLYCVESILLIPDVTSETVHKGVHMSHTQGVSVLTLGNLISSILYNSRS